MPIQSRIGVKTNIGLAERVVSAVAGGALMAYGLTKRSLPGAAMGAAGGALLVRGAFGHCPVKSRLEEGGRGHLERTFTVSHKAPEEVYEFWRKLDNLPSVMENLESVEVLSGQRSHWIMKGPAGRKIEWDAEIVNDRSGRLIQWKSLPGSDIELSGTVRFRGKQGRGTKVHVSLDYRAPGGAVGERIAKLFHLKPIERLDAGIQNVKEALNQA